MTRIRSLLFFLIVILLIAGAFLYLKPHYFNKVEKYSVSIAVSKSPLSTPFYIAKSINAFEDTCVEVEYNEVLGGLAAFDNVIKGEVDFGTSSDSVIAFQSLTKQAFVTHAMFVQSDNDVKLLTYQVDKVKSAAELKGKKIGVTKGSASEYFLSTLLAIEGLSVEDVELYNYKPADLINGLNNNEVDAIVPWEPFAFNAVKLLKNKVTVQNTKNVNTLSFNLISKIADDLLVEKATCLIQGLNVAIAYIATHPEKSKKIVIDELHSDPSFIDWVWDDYVFKLGLNQSLIFNIKSQAAWAIDMQMSEYNEMPNIDDFIDSRAMIQVDPGAVNIPL
ncbi:ABC transporter substrate-binding protein [Pseudocolwellia sp. HL-MZ7]|uniref:ABC transporter substrate-binding protein n=1 Tax=Pseudocolwellia sp. HL-MZ7 TaxID=3400627 RepID=UPI003CEDEC96